MVSENMVKDYKSLSIKNERLVLITFLVFIKTKKDFLFLNKFRINRLINIPFYI